MMGLWGYGWGSGDLNGGSITYDRSTGTPLSHPSARHPHESVTGWNKWLLGWLDGPEASACRPTNRRRSRCGPTSSQP